MKKFRRQKRFAFPHKTMAEFLAASHLIHLDRNEQESWMKEIDLEFNIGLVKFIMGKSQADEDLLKTVATEFLKKAMERDWNRYIEILSELKEIPDCLETIIASCHPTTIETFYNSPRSLELFLGVKTLKPRTIDVTLPSSISSAIC
jgi:hypothetical protein